MLEYRQIKHTEHDQMESLRDYCFRHEYTGNYLKDFRNWMEWSDNLGAFSNDELKGQVMILPLNMVIHGVPYKMGGIGFVSSYPESRNAGIMKHLLIDSLTEMRRNGQYVSVLAPFSVSFYRHFGWEIFFDEMEYTISTHQFPKFPKQNNHFARFGFHDEKNFMIVKEMYNDYAMLHNGMMLRDDKWWSRLKLRESKSVFGLYYDEEMKPKGFIRYEVDDVTFIIKDFIAFDFDAEKALWEYITSHSSSIFTIKGTASAHKSFGIEFSDPQFKKEIVHNVMIRIVDVEKFLLAYPFHSVPEPLYVKVFDRHAEWNNHVFKIEGKGKVSVMQDEVFETDLLSTDINTLSAMFAGYRKPSEYAYYGHIKANKEVLQQFEQAIPYDHPQLFEHF